LPVAGCRLPGNGRGGGWGSGNGKGEASTAKRQSQRPSTCTSTRHEHVGNQESSVGRGEGRVSGSGGCGRGISSEDSDASVQLFGSSDLRRYRVFRLPRLSEFSVAQRFRGLGDHGGSESRRTRRTPRVGGAEVRGMRRCSGARSVGGSRRVRGVIGGIGRRYGNGPRTTTNERRHPAQGMMNADPVHWRCV